MCGSHVRVACRMKLLRGRGMFFIVEQLLNESVPLSYIGQYQTILRRWWALTDRTNYDNMYLGCVTQVQS